MGPSRRLPVWPLKAGSDWLVVDVVAEGYAHKSSITTGVLPALISVPTWTTHDVE
jgi:hypothetical protein